MDSQLLFRAPRTAAPRFGVGARRWLMRRSPATQRMDSLETTSEGLGWASSTLWLLSWTGVVLLALVVFVLSMTPMVAAGGAAVHVQKKETRT